VQHGRWSRSAVKQKEPKPQPYFRGINFKQSLIQVSQYVWRQLQYRSTDITSCWRHNDAHIMQLADNKITQTAGGRDQLPKQELIYKSGGRWTVMNQHRCIWTTTALERLLTSINQSLLSSSLRQLDISGTSGFPASYIKQLLSLVTSRLRVNKQAQQANYAY